MRGALLYRPIKRKETVVFTSLSTSVDCTREMYPKIVSYLIAGIEITEMTDNRFFVLFRLEHVLPVLIPISNSNSACSTPHLMITHIGKEELIGFRATGLLKQFLLFVLVFTSAFLSSHRAIGQSQCPDL